jgi:DNA-binding transcriptional LysR family regulator
LNQGQWDDFRYFLAVAKTSSIKRAAAALKTTQSAVSKRLDRLEGKLGMRLLERGPLGTRLTYQGQRILRHASAADIAFKQAHESAEEAETRIMGDCSIKLTDGLANYWFASFLPGFFNRYPEVELKMMLDVEEDAEKSEVFDITLDYTPPADTTKITKPLCAIHFIPFASQDYIARYGAPRSIEELSRHRLIDQTKYLISKGSWASWFNSAPLQHTSLFTNRSVFLGSAVQAGAGIALMPTYLTLFDSRLVPLDIGMRLALKVFANYHREQALKHSVRSALNYMRDYIFDVKNMPWFADEFAMPSAEWRSLRRRAIERATESSDHDDIAAE